MKLHGLFFLSHALTAAVVGASFWAAGLSGDGSLGIATGAIALATLGGTSFLLTRSFRRSLALLQSVVANPGEPASAATGIHEFDRAAEQLSEHAGRWDEMAANGHEQAREIQVILTRLNGRGSTSETPGSELRQLLAGIGQTVYGNLEQMEQQAAEISRCTEEIAGGAETQSNAVTKTSTYVEQLSANIDSVSNNAKLVQTSLLGTGGSASEAAKLVNELIQGLDRIRRHSEANETKLRGLGDRSQQISSIVETIGDLAARTDLLALNASIESIRAGEHGRGFAVVAEEVRKLAEQAAQATREIAGLIDSMQLATQESVTRIAQERSEVQAEASLAEAAAGILVQIRTATEDEASRAGEIAATAHQQLQLTQDVVLAVEQISHIAKSSRSRAENACWTTRSLANTCRQFGDEIDRLRACSDRRRECRVETRLGSDANSEPDHQAGTGEAPLHREFSAGAGRPALEVPSPAEI